MACRGPRPCSALAEYAKGLEDGEEMEPEFPMYTLPAASRTRFHPISSTLFSFIY